ncbi:hypothetical protein [Saccharomonospora piscinae]|nr:hypothetical protein [Saccharomonospora piscinae]
MRNSRACLAGRHTAPRASENDCHDQASADAPELYAYDEDGQR